MGQRHTSWADDHDADKRSSHPQADVRNRGWPAGCHVGPTGANVAAIDGPVDVSHSADVSRSADVSHSADVDRSAVVADTAQCVADAPEAPLGVTHLVPSERNPLERPHTHGDLCQPN